MTVCLFSVLKTSLNQGDEDEDEGGEGKWWGGETGEREGKCDLSQSSNVSIITSLIDWINCHVLLEAFCME